MPRISEVAVLEKGEQPTLMIRTTTTIAELPHVIGGSYRKLAAYLARDKKTLSDVPYVRFLNFEPKQLEVEIGFPVATPLQGDGAIVSGNIPAGLYAFCMYLGAYNQMEPVYAEMDQWIADNGYQTDGTSYEYYYNDDQFAEEALLTMIVKPLK